MRKIKGLKLPVRYYEIERKAKKIEGIKLVEKEEIDYLKNFISSIISELKVSVVYDIFEIDKNGMFKSFLHIKRSNYASAGFLTFGWEIEKKAANYMDQERLLFDIIVDVHLKTAFDSLKDMILEEAKKERLNCQDIITVYSPTDANKQNHQICQFIYESLNIKDGLIEYDNGIIRPFYTWAFIIPWISSKG